MITEGRLEHLEAIAAQIEKYEKWEPRWDIIKIMMSSFASVAFFGFGLLVTNSLTESPTIVPEVSFWIKSISIGSAFASLFAFAVNNIHNKERKEQFKTEAAKMRDILKKVKESIVKN